MSTHRADRHRASKAREETPGQAPTSPSPGRRKTPPAPRRSGRVTSPTVIGGFALLVAAAGAATAGQAISAGQDVTATSSNQNGSYVASTSSASLEGRDATKVSRGDIRPVLASTSNGKSLASTSNGKSLAQEFNARSSAAKTAAQLLADERDDKLGDAAAQAETYAEELSSDEWVLPTSDFHISTWFGEAGPYWASGYHTGVDFATAYGTPAVAVTTAVVVHTGWDGPYGNQVRLQLENGDEVWYNHLSSIDVVTGQQVVKGQHVGRVGETGNAYGAHLHFEYRLASNLHDGVDPVPFFLEHDLTL